MIRTDEILKSNITKVYFRFLAPAVTGSALVAIYSFVDVVFIGLGTGSTGLAAFNIALPIYNLLGAFSIIFGVGGATTIAVMMGQGDKRKASEVFSVCVYTVLAFGLLICLFGLLFLDPFSRFLGASENILSGTKMYLGTILAFTPVFMLSWSMNTFVRNDGNPKIVMIGNVSTSLLNIILDYLFVLVFKWGLFGAAFATGLSCTVSMLIVLTHFRGGKANIRLIFFKYSFKQLLRVIQNGMGTFFLEISLGISIFIFNRVLMAMGGEDYVSAYAVISTIQFVVFAVSSGCAQSSQTIIGVNYGAGRFDRVRQCLKTACMVVFAYGCIAYGILAVFPGPIASLFVHDSQAVLDIAVVAIRLFFLSTPITGVLLVFTYFLQSMESFKGAILISLSRGIVFMAVGIAVLAPFLAENGVWLSVTFGELCTLTFAVPMVFKKLKWLAQKEKANL